LIAFNVFASGAGRLYEYKEKRKSVNRGRKNMEMENHALTTGKRA